ncbi:uncharacterized protein LOC100369881 [Saccoglossus kowalevskii]|uniref:Uncharacterized protein LOC100369881 isoform X1 n=1 Tax=Saccoglossus kowalevskii TaxID=10224 RepID=A0ABM0MRK9_SACKO|nr:PREDICTED: uncharacterized protein LOC100369881 isoform X1 [Saccoglossus kowalevskii]XP_006822650.1 PREDICTED: uncharacterized protein LOC100369881 isoform X2 [Saccoglossus kowalevskii]
MVRSVVTFAALFLLSMCNLCRGGNGDESPFLDMTHVFKEGETIGLPTANQYTLSPEFAGFTEGGYYYEANNYCVDEHSGTHIDAPGHLVEGMSYVDEIPLDMLIGPAVKIDIKDKGDVDPDAQLMVDDLLSWEEANGEIPDDVILMVYTGWGSRWPDKERYLGTATNDMTMLHFPGVHPNASQWLVDNRKIKMLGIDTASLDYGPAVLYESHTILFKSNIPVLKNVAELDKLPTLGSTVFALPMKLFNGTGAPTRIFATGWSDDVKEPCQIAAKSEESPFLDMSYSFIEGETIYWPTADPYVREAGSSVNRDGYYFETNSFCAAEHGGTHFDAPGHFAENKQRVHQVPLDSLIGPAIKVDISSKAANDPDAEVTVDDITQWEEENGPIPDGAILLMYSGWGQRWPDKLTYLGTEGKNTSILHFPGFSPDTARWLIANKKIRAVGVDTPSIDFGQSRLYESHQLLFANNIPGLENVGNLDKLPAKGSFFFAVPMKIYNGSGASTRMFATGWSQNIDNPCEEVDISGANPLTIGLIPVVMCVLLKAYLLLVC